MCDYEVGSDHELTLSGCVQPYGNINFLASLGLMPFIFMHSSTNSALLVLFESGKKLHEHFFGVALFQ